MAIAERGKRMFGGTQKRPVSDGPRILLEVEKEAGTYRLFDPQLEISVHNKDLGAGFAEISELRALVLEKLDEAAIPAPYTVSSRLAPREPAAPTPELASKSRKKEFTSQQKDGEAGTVGAVRTRSHSSRWLIVLVCATVVAVLVYAVAAGPVLRAMKLANTAVAKLEELNTPGVASRLASRSVEWFARSLQNMTPARKEELRQNLRIIARELKPFMVEIAPAIEPLSAPQPANDGPETRPDDRERQ